MGKKAYIFSIVFFLLIANISYAQKKTTPFDKIKSINGYPIYPKSRFSEILSFTGERQWLLTYLTNDKVNKVIRFYERKLNRKAEMIKYGKSLIIYQFPKDYTMVNKRKLLTEGVEIIPFGGFYRKVFKANTKIKIYVKPPPPK
jgi:hypothetical protein